MSIGFINMTNDNFDERLKQYFDDVDVEKVEIYLSNNIVRIYLNADYWPSEEVYNLANTYFKKQYPGSISIEIYLKNKSKSAVQELLEYHMDLISTLLIMYEPSISNWLNGVVWNIDEINNDILEINVSNEVVFRQLIRLNADKLLNKFFKHVLGLSINIKIICSQSCQIEAKPLNLIMSGSSNIQGSESASSRESGQKNICEISEKKKNRARYVILGRAINMIPIPIASIVEEDNRICCEGTIFDLEFRDLKTGRTMVTFCITDLTNSIECKFFCEKDNQGEIKDRLKKSVGIRLAGKAYIDRYTQELTLMPESINEVALTCRIDQAEVKRVELHLHTQMSNMDGVSKIEKLIKLASDLGHTHIAITDHGVVQAFPDAYFLGKKYNIKIIYGMEAYIFDDSIPDNQKPRTYHCILLAKNKIGLKNLYRLTTESHLRYFKKRPRIPKRLINYAREGLIIGSACEAGELMQHLIHYPDDEKRLKELAQFYDYIEIQPIDNNAFMIRKGLANSRDDLVQLNKKLFNLGREMNKPVVATCDVHFANEEEAIFRSILMESKGFKDAEQQAPLFYRTTEEMLEEFDYLGEDAYSVVVEAPRAIADVVEDLKPVPDKLYAPKIEGAETKIEELTYQKAHQLYGDDLPEIVQNRIDKELKAIIGNGFAVLYLIAHELVKKSNDDGYVVGSRGSVGSSVVAYLTGITEVNALPPHYRCECCRYSEFDGSGIYGTGVDMPDQACPKCGQALTKDGFNIPFEIFLGFKGDKVPDIDLNFSGEYQPRAHAFTEELFGKDNVFRAGTIATVAEKTAFGYVRKFYEERGEKIRNAEVNRLRNGCTGVKRTTGQHPGGLMVIPKNIDVHDFSPLQRPADDVKTEIVTTHFDYHSINERLVKLDILGHDDPTVIKILEDITGIDVKTIPLDDPATMSLFSSTEILGVAPEELNSSVATYGIPEFNTKFTRQMLEDIKPDSFAALLRISGFSHGTDVWLNNAQDLIREGLASVTETISTRDDIMIFLIQHGIDFHEAFSIMEKVRKGKGITDEHITLLERNNIPKWFIDSCKKIKYLFPKAHAVAYVIMAYRIAWFKINFPLAFYASYFSVRGLEEFNLEDVLCEKTEILRKINNIYSKGSSVSAKEKSTVSVLEVVLELLTRGYKILPVDLYYSDAKKFLIRDDGILPPLVSISGLGQTIATTIAEARSEKKFISVEDLKKRGKVNDAMIHEMRKLKIIDNLPDFNQILLF